jgi:putative methyltransferase (TIGR04325 family)
VASGAAAKTGGVIAGGRPPDGALAIASGGGKKAAMSEAKSFRTLMGEKLPPALVAFLRRIRRRRAFVGNYHLWAEARANSRGYEHSAVLAQVIVASRAVVAGRAAWDRDGALFAQPEVNAPLLAALRRIAAGEGGRLDLVDFGGALGSTWRQHRAALGDLTSVRWRVVEQLHYVEAGREFADTVLSFHPSLDEALQEKTASTLLCSSVLPYLEQPWALLDAAVRRGFRHIVIDRTPFAADGRQRIVVQRVPAELGGGSYPCWLFARDELLAPLAARYRLVSEWPGFDAVDPAAVYRGFWFERLP